MESSKFLGKMSLLPDLKVPVVRGTSILVNSEKRIVNGLQNFLELSYLLKLVKGNVHEPAGTQHLQQLPTEVT